MRRYGASLLILILLNITYTAIQARDFYWIGGSGNFNDIQHWSDQPGGKVNPDALLPGKDDNVYFDEHSFPEPGAKVVITNVARCANMYWGNVSNIPTLTTDDNPAHYLVIYGGVTFTDQMVIDLERPLYFRANTLGNVIDFGGNTFDGDLVFENNGGWRITGVLDILNNDISFNQGTLSIESEVNCGRIVSETTVSRELYLNSSTINLNNKDNAVISLQTDNLTTYPGNSVINVLSDNSSIETSGVKRIEFNDVIFAGNLGSVVTSAIQATFNKLTFQKDGSLSGENDFQELTFTEGHSYTIDTNGVQNVQSLFTAKGQCYAYINITGKSSGGFISADAVDLDYLKVNNVTAGGVAVNFAANNSYDLGGNTGWNFTAPSSDDYTWTGTTDNNWGTPSNWNKGCVPSRNNNAIIPAGFTVEINVPAECKSLDVDDSSALGGSEILNIFGSLTATNSSWAFNGETHFKGNNPGNTISINATMPGQVTIDGNTEWVLTTDLSINNTLNLNSGILNAGGFVVNVNQFVSNSALSRTLDISNTNLNINEGVSKAWHVEGSGFSFNGIGSEITLTQTGAGFYNNSSDGINYSSVIFKSMDGQVFLTNENPANYPFFEKLEFDGSAKIVGNHQYSKLVLTKGNEYLFQEGSIQKILNLDGFEAEGSCSEYITLKGDGGIAFIDSDVNSSKIVQVRVEDVNVTGGVVGAGGLTASQSIAVSNYDGWHFLDDLTGGDIYWTGEKDNNWFESENWNTKCIPTRKDNVFFEDASVTGSSEVNISIKGKIAECNNMTWNTSSSMTFSGNQPLNIFGSLDMSGMIVGSNSYSGDINFKAEAAQDITIGTVQLISNLNFVGNQQDDSSWKSGPWNIRSDLVTIGNIDIKRGTLATNNFNIEASEFYSNYGTDNARSLELGSSVLRIDRMEISAESFTLSAGTSEIQFAVAGDLIISDGDQTLSFYNITFEEATGNAYVDIFADNVSFNNMVFSGNTYFRKPNDSKTGFTAESIQMAIGKTYVFERGQTYILGNLVANGACEGTIDISGSDSDAAIFQAKSGVTNIEVNSVNLLNLHAEPADVFVAKSSMNLGNTTGWKFEDEPAGKDLYWIGGEGYWDNPNNWSTSSGGSPNGCVPTAKDNVYFDLNSFDNFDQVVYTGAGDIRCRTMDWTGSEGARPRFEMGDTDISGVYIYGSFILNNAVEIDLSPLVNFYFRANEAHTINTYGYVFPNVVEFDGKNGAWTLHDSMVVEGDVLIQHGKLKTDGNYLECKSIVSAVQTEGQNSRGLDIQNSQIVITGKDDVYNRSFYVNLSDNSYEQGFEMLSDNSTIRFTNTAELVIFRSTINTISFDEIIFEKDGILSGGAMSGVFPYYSRVLFKQDGKILGENKFGTLEFGRGFNFEFDYKSGRVYEMDYLIVDGSCFAPISIYSSDNGSQVTISSANNVTGNFLQLKDINADTSGGVTYTATNSFDLGNVSGWTIDNAIAPIALYWTGNGTDDSWNNHENWSRTADGSEEGCVPTINDDVYFTSSSFLGSKLVEITTNATCHSMTWYDDIDPDANFSVNAKLQLGGFMDLTETMSLDMQGTFEFVGDGLTGDKIVDFAEKTMDGDIKFQGDGQSWVWESGMATSGDLYIEAGSVSTQEHSFTVNRFSSLSSGDINAVRKFDMSGSLVTVTSGATDGWKMKMNTPGGLDFISTNSQITFENGGGIDCETDGDVYFGFVYFMDNGVINIHSTSDTEHGHFGLVAFYEQGQVYGTNDFTNLEFTLGYEDNIIESGKVITVEHDLKMEGVRCSYVFLRASTPGDFAFIHKPTGVFDKIYNAALTDIHGSTGSGAVDHPVKYHYEENNCSGFVLWVDPGGDDNPPSFEESFDQPREEWCSDVAVLDHVMGFPINNSTTFQWYFSADNGVTDPYEELVGETNATIEVTESGFYKVEVHYGVNGFDGTDCKIESTIEVALGEVSNVSLEITAKNVKCFGEGNGRIVARVASVQYPEYQFFWKNEAGVDFTASTSTNQDTWTSTAINLEPGKYSITVADGKNCTFDTIVNVFDAYELLIDSIESKHLTCYTVPEGEILVNASGGTGNLSYFLDGELQASENITGLSSGSYTVYVQDENNCKTEEENVMLNSNPEITVDLNGLDLKCYGDANGLFSPVVTGGVPDYSYSWTGPGGFSSTDLQISGLTGGLYQLTVTDDVGCTAAEEQELNEPAELIVDELVVKPANCHGETTGEIFVVGGQGTPGYSYFLNDEEEATGIFTGLASGNYPLLILDANGCRHEQEVEVSEPSDIGFLIADKILPSCEKTEDGIIHITPYGGNEGYSFSWTGPNDYKSYQQDIENLVSGKYALQITDKKNCTSIDSVDLDLGLTLQLGLVVEQHVETPGSNEGILAIELIEGTVPYIFTVIGPGGTINSPDNFDDHYYLIENLPAGVYTVVATDASSCTTVEKSVIIEEPGALYAYIDQEKPVGCVGASDGELKAIVAGGSGSYTYSWSGPSGYAGTGQVISGLAPGNYTLTVNDGGNSTTATYELLPADPIVVSIANYKDVSCYQSADGVIELSVDAGNADYTIEWTGADGFLSSAKRVMNLEPGTYSYKVSTVEGCSVSGTQDIIEPTDMNIAVTPVDISKEGERDGSVTTTFGGGTAPYTVLISGPNGYSFAELNNTSGSATVDGLEMGIYEVAVIDANGCRIEEAKKVHEPAKLLLYTTSVTHIICPGESTGAITIGVDDASDPANLTFTWEGDNYFRSNDKDISDIAAGTYKLTVYDSGGDPGYEEQSLIVIVKEPEVLTVEFSTENISCPGMTDGYINIQPQGGTPGYAYAWTGTGVAPNNEDQANLVPGTYSVQITDINGCISDPVSIEITEPDPLMVSVADSKEPTCYGLENGWIELDIAAGIGPYIINWDNYGSVTQKIEDLTQGVYDYTVTDDNECSQSGSITLNEPDTLIAEINDFTNVLCEGGDTGYAFVDIIGGTPDYNILWSDGQNTQEAVDLKFGTYEVLVVDAQGCEDTSSIEILEPESLEMKVEVIRPTTYEAMDGSINVNLTGGVPGYIMEWVDQDMNSYTGNDIRELERGTYYFTATDQNNCQIDSTIVLEYLFERRIKIPKAFTPNADGYNDYWDIERIEFVQDLKIVICDRWGKTVYKFSGTGNEYRGEPWTGVDGTMNLPIGSYYYAVEVDDEKPMIGTVTIFR